MDSLPPSSLDSWTFRRVMWATLLLVFVALGFWLLYRFYQVIFIVFIAILMGTVIRPVINWLNKRGIHRVAGFIIISILLLVLFIGFMLLLFPMVMDQGSTIVADVPGYYQNLRLWLANTGNPMIVGLGDFLPATLPNLAPIQQTGQQALSLCRTSNGLCNVRGEIYFYYSGGFIIGFSLDIGWTANNSILAVTPSKRSA